MAVTFVIPTRSNPLTLLSILSLDIIYPPLRLDAKVGYAFESKSP